MLGYLNFSRPGQLTAQTAPNFPNATSVLNGKIFSKNAPKEFAQTRVWLIGKITKLFTDGFSLHDFAGNQELLVQKLYDSHGDSFIELLDGLFFIVICDTAKQKLGLYNNRYQASNLYYCTTPSFLLFGKSLADVLSLMPGTPEIHKGSLLNFISNGFTSSDQTQIQGIKKLLPTACIVAQNGSVEIKNHWAREFSFDRKPFGDLEAHLDKYEAVYRGGLENYFAQTKPNELGCLLSGGHDTSFAFIQGSKVHRKPVHAFTATFPGWAFDEGKPAENIATKFGGKFHPVPFGPEHLDYMLDVIRTVEEPIVGTCLPTHLCAREASKYVDTMIAGDGGDTIWAEYYPVAEFHRYAKRLPSVGRRGIHFLSKLLVKATDWERFWELEHVSSLFTQKEFYNDFMRRLCTYRHFTDAFQRELFTPEFLAATPISRSSLELQFSEKNFSEMLIESKLINGFYCYQSFHTTKSFERFNTGFYLPTINKDLMTFITSLPPEWVNGGTTFQRLTNSKKINRLFHKKALQRYIGKDEIYNRSFDIPWHRILRPRKALLAVLLRRLKKRGWYQERTLDGLFKEFSTQEVKDHELLELKHHGYRIFTLLSLELWCTEFIDGRLRSPVGERVPLEEYLSGDGLRLPTEARAPAGEQLSL